MGQKQKLELTWIGKENRPRLEPRILLEDPEKSYHAAERVTEKDIFDNRLIFGDNLLALKALEQEFAGKVKCIFIDPPYNTGSAFEHYDDGLEHSIWLCLMRDRIEIVKRLMSRDGSLWITVDDNEAHYLKIVCDEIFGRRNFAGNLVWQKRTARDNRKAFSVNHDHILVYASDLKLFTSGRNLLPLTQVALSRYKNPDNDPRGPWQSVAMTAQAGHATPAQFYTLETPTGKKYDPPKGLCWIFTKERFAYEVREGNIYFPKGGDGVPRVKRFMKSDGSDGLVPESIWLESESGTNDDAKKHSLQLLASAASVFDSAKPETLLRRIIQIGSNPGDLVLDSFAGSGTTGAVAHKMGRRWIMVELGEHCHTHIIPRLKKVIDGQDAGGITEAVNWRGGGGFRYYRLAPSLLEMDGFGRPVINKKYNAAMLAEAMCKLMGFRYEPSDTVYWQQGRSNETAFVYTTTQTLSAAQLQQLSEEVGENRSLVICTTAIRAKAKHYPNLELKLIPQTVLARCEWGKDDYSLRVENLPAARTQTAETEQQELFEVETR